VRTVWFCEWKILTSKYLEKLVWILVMKKRIWYLRLNGRRWYSIDNEDNALKNFRPIQLRQMCREHRG
jgi:hypothetical protein